MRIILALGACYLVSQNILAEKVASVWYSGGRGSYEMEISRDSNVDYLVHYQENSQPECNLTFRLYESDFEHWKTIIEAMPISELDRSGPHMMAIFFEYSIRKSDGTEAVIYTNAKDDEEGPVYHKYNDGRADEIIEFLDKYAKAAGQACDMVRWGRPLESDQ